MIPAEFLDLIRKATEEDRDSVRLATVGTVTGNSATVTFDGETVATPRQYPGVSYTPVAGARVAMLRAGHGWVILGEIDADGGGGGAATVAVKAGRTTTTTTTAGAWVSVPFDTESYDTHGFHDLAANTHRFTVPAGQGGLYDLVGGIELDPGSDTGDKHLRLYVDYAAGGGTTLAMTSAAGAQTYTHRLQVACHTVLADGDVVTLGVFTASAMTVQFATTFCALRRVGETP